MAASDTTRTDGPAKRRHKLDGSQVRTPNVSSVQTLHLLAMEHEDFEPSKFSNAPGKLKVALHARKHPFPRHRTPRQA